MRTLGLSLLALLAALPAHAGKPATLEGAKLALTVKADQGFLDDIFAFDGSGGRLAFVRTDGTQAEIEILDLAQGGRSLARFDVSKQAVAPLRVAFAADGGRLILVGKPDAGAKPSAHVFDLQGKLLRSFGPATDFAFASLGGAEVLTSFDSRADTKKNTVYEVAAYDLETGKTIGKKRSLIVAPDGLVASLNLVVVSWANGYTQLIGKKKGAYDKFKDQRAPDSVGLYDVVEGVLVRDTPVGDVIERAKLDELRAKRFNQASFVVVSADLHNVELITADDRRVALTLAEPFSKYDYKSLIGRVARDGRLYFTLTVDPTNPDAVAAKVTDPELIDLYTVDPTSGTASRLCRIPKGDRPFAWDIASGRLALLRKHKTFARGGAELEVYEIGK